MTQAPRPQAQPAPAPYTLREPALREPASHESASREPAPAREPVSPRAPQSNVDFARRPPAPPSNRAPSPAPRPATQHEPAPNIHAEASGVWQRIDQAQGSPSPHQVASPSRPTASVGAVAGPPARRLQAAAMPPKAPPSAPASSLPLSAEPSQAIGDNEEDLPVISDQELALVDRESLQTKRRTVADFLYAAGQYTPGRILSGHPAHTPHSGPTAPTSQAPAELATAQLTNSQYAESTRSSAHSVMNSAVTNQPPMNSAVMNQPIMNQPVMNQAATSSYASGGGRSGTAAQTMPVHTSPVQTATAQTYPAHVTPAVANPAIAPMDDPIAEPMPRRMGQILRVDLPRGAQQNATASANASTDQVQATSVAPATIAKAEKTAEVDVAARYVLEQRRIDRAHQISELEEKLRQDTHKVFNPVWEVDRLQWPSVVDKLMQHRAESMAQVAAHMKAACQDGLSVLGVTSPGKGEGRTTVACCLARLAASHGLNVCLVDLDLDHPTLCIQTNMEVEYDWRDCLTDELSLEEVAVHSLEDHLTILPLKPRGGRPGLLASDSRLAEMLDELAASFELVVVDCSKVNSAGNVISGLTHANIFNAAILVVDRRDTQQSRIEDAVLSIQNSGIESIGIVDNFAM